MAGEKAQREDPLSETHKIEDILGEILPPKEFVKDNGQLWVQTVLSTPATKIEVVQLREELDKRLKQRQARQFGLCAEREELFSQCFDELIRQITIDCRERGELLVSVRNEYCSQIRSYKTLYESSIAYGMKRVIDSEDNKARLVCLTVRRARRSPGWRRSAATWRATWPGWRSGWRRRGGPRRRGRSGRPRRTRSAWPSSRRPT